MRSSEALKKRGLPERSIIINPREEKNEKN
jgi:hypothetical protein